MGQKKQKLSSQDSEMKKLADLGCDQLDDEMKEVFTEKASLISTWLLWEMVQTSQTFEEVSVDLCRRLLRIHQTAQIVNAGRSVQEYLDEHTVTGEL